LKKIFNFLCKKCGDFEEYVEYTQTTECPTCGGQAAKIITAPTIKLEGISGAFPGAAISWEKRHKITKSRDE
jgi:putative FmdB family regulatory protein